jgi:16S rRNA (cytidine1402-2'-O)-methyltransferase
MATLFIVATPIGNLEDITLRALRILKEADLILCEDTRVTKKLLQKYEIKTPVESYHAHSNASKVKKILGLLKSGKNLALVTDAGTPGISDPGPRFVSEVRKEFRDVKIVPIPGTSAVTAALSVSGLPADEFVFLGFLPHKKGRETTFKEIVSSKKTIIFYESTHRILRTLETLSQTLSPERTIVVFGELTKFYEKIIQGNAYDVFTYFKKTKDAEKGEFVVIVEGV